MDLIFIISICFSFVIAIIAFINLIFSIHGKSVLVNNQKLSILIPVRNEERNILKLLRSIESQTFKDYEIIVLDDESTDNTYRIVADFINEKNNFHLIKGVEKPTEWSGKNWACHQLSKKAKYEMVLFLDADVVLSDNALQQTLEIFIESKVDMLSYFPTQIIKGSGYLTIPIINIILLSFLPLILVYKSKFSSLAAANGQFMMFKRSTYEKTGGHKRLFNKNVEDIYFSRLLKKDGYKVLTLLGKNLVKCEMYTSFKDSFNGLSRSFYNGTALPPIPFIFVLLFIFSNLFFVFIFPIFDNRFFIPLLLQIFSIIFISISSRQNILLNIILRPLHNIMLLLIGIWSLYLSTTKKLIWKGRRV